MQYHQNVQKLNHSTTAQENTFNTCIAPF